MPGFQKVPEAYAHDYRYTDAMHIREIYTPMPYMSLALYLSLDEVHEPAVMIDKADAELQALQVIRRLNQMEWHCFLPEWQGLNSLFTFAA